MLILSRPVPSRANIVSLSVKVKSLSPADALYIQMGEAWINGICSPYEFRKCKSSDLKFVKNYGEAVNKIREQNREKEEHEAKVQEVMRMMQHG